jgi:hypothetical protein
VSTQTLAPPPTAHVATLGAKVTRTALAVLLFLQGAVLTLWALSWASEELSEHGLLHVSYPAWAGAALWVVLFGAAIRATIVAGVAVWQTAWGSPGQIGAKKVNAAWTAVVVNAALVPGLALAATLAGDSPEAADIQNLFWFVVFGGAIAAGLAFFALRPPLRWAGWRHVTKAVVACVILLVGAGIMFQDQRIGFADSLRSYFFPGTTASAACPGLPDETCAARAARQAGGPVAWVPAPTGYGLPGRSGSLVVNGHQATESLRSSIDGSLLHLYTNATGSSLCVDGTCTHRRAVRVGHRTIVIHWGFATGAGYVAVANWSQDGRQFSLSTRLPDHPVDLRWFANVLRSIQYAGG